MSTTKQSMARMWWPVAIASLGGCHAVRGGSASLFSTGELLTSTLPVAYPYKFWTLCSLQVTSEAGDAVMVDAQFQASTSRASVAHFLALHDQRTVWQGQLATSAPHQSVHPALPAGEVVAKGMGSSFRSLVGNFAMPRNGSMWVSLVAYASGAGAVNLANAGLTAVSIAGARLAFSGANSELISSLPMSYHPYHGYTVYEAQLECQNSSAVRVAAQFEAYSPYSYDEVQLSAFLAKHNHSVHYNGRDLSYLDDSYRLVPPAVPAGENIWATKDKGVRNLVGVYACQPWDASAWISTVMYSASTGEGSGAHLTVEQGYGGVALVALPSSTSLYVNQNALIQSLPFGASSAVNVWTLYTIEVPHRARGDIIHVDAQFEVTNPYKYPVSLCHYLALHTTRTVFQGTPSSAAKYAAMLPGIPAGESVTHDMHHTTRRVHGSIIAPQNGSLWASLVIYARSSAATTGSALTVEGGGSSYGGLSVLSFPTL